MLSEIIELQDGAVSKLVNLIETSTQSTLTFRAPTGSGKTYMMADFMNRLLVDDSTIFLMSSLSKGGLAKQNYDKFIEYQNKNEFPNLQPYLIESESFSEERLYIPTNYNVYVLPRDLYKEGTILKTQNTLLNFLLELRFKQNKRIICIRDECHIETANLNELSDSFFDRTVNFSATPNLSRGQSPDFEITDEEAQMCGLIKMVEWGDENDSFETVLNKFNEIKEDHINKLGVNPCLIVQISNKDKAEEEMANQIMPVLDANPDIKWMSIFGKTANDLSKCETNDNLKAKKLPVSKWKDYAKDDLSLIDVIIFKMVISEGWDIPRACMLYQVRDSKSKQLDEQVLGRIRRNPRLLDFETLPNDARHLATTAWAWGIVKDKDKKYASVRLQKNSDAIVDALRVKTTRLKNISEKADFDINAFMKKQKASLVTGSIFDLYRGVQKCDNSTKQIIYSYAGDDYRKWFEVSGYASAIQASSQSYMCDYSQSMEIDCEQSFQESSYYICTNYTLNVSNWVWRRKSGGEKFSFDSEAEELFADFLRELSFTAIQGTNDYMIKQDQLNLLIEADRPESMKNIFLWGKNFTPNSLISFEYCLDSIHKSYPDFIMKDKFNRVHIFEVKSLNQSSALSVDNAEYVRKIEELKKCYMQASKITGQCFYLPILRNDVWHLISYIDGVEYNWTTDQFRTFVNSNNKNTRLTDS